MLRFGIVDNNHDASIAVIENNHILFASQSERFSGIKNDPVLTPSLIRYVKDKYGTPDEVHYFETPYNTHHFLNGQFHRVRTKRKVEQYLRDTFQTSRISFQDHHLSHAATGFHTSDFDNATIVVADAIGQNDTVSIYTASTEEGFKRIFRLKYPDSIGLFVSAMTARLGLTPCRDEYILMGMAAYGRPIYKQRILNDFFSRFDVDLRLKIDCHRSIDHWGDFPETEYFNIAASVQSIFEDYVLELIKYARLHTSSENLVLGGGCFLNCVANSKIAQLGIFSNIWINPNPGDGGSALGAVSLETGCLEYTNSFLGYEITPKYQIREAVDVLLTGNPVGFASGKAEFGPRALGNRSLLLDPRLLDGKEILNIHKQRQAFRPFAPIVLEDHATDFFNLLDVDHRFMQYTVTQLSDELHATRHIDSSARVQVVNKSSGLIYNLLKYWYDQTGCPVLVNTSLNIKDKPIVNDEADARSFELNYEIPVFS